MATHSSLLAWRIPWTEEPGGLHAMGSQRLGHDWVTNTSNDVELNAQGLILRGKRAWFKLECRLWLKPVFIQHKKFNETKPKMAAYGCRITDDFFFSFSHFALPSLASFPPQWSCLTLKKFFIWLNQVSCGMQDLHCPARTLQLQCPGLVVPPHVGSQILDQGSDPHLLTLQGGFLTTGPPGKPCIILLFDLVGPLEFQKQCKSK